MEELTRTMSEMGLWDWVMPEFNVARPELRPSVFAILIIEENPRVFDLIPDLRMRFDPEACETWQDLISHLSVSESLL